MASIFRVLVLVSFFSILPCLGCGKGADSANDSDDAMISSDIGADESDNTQTDETLDDDGDLDFEGSTAEGKSKRSPGSDEDQGESIAPPTGFGPNDISLSVSDSSDESGTEVEKGESFSLEHIELSEPNSDAP